MPNSNETSFLLQQLQIYEQLISRNNYETAYLFDPDGKLIFKKRGTTKSVRFSRLHLIKMFGNILTHNHVYEKEYAHYGLASAISSSDISLAFKHKLLEIRMVLEDSRYSFRWLDVGQEDANDLIKRLQTVENGCKVLRDNVEEKLINLEYTTEDDFQIDFYATIRKNAEEINTFFEVNRDVGYIYSREG